MADKFLSDRVLAIQPSATMALATRAREMRAAGRDVISLTAGEPDMPTPERIVNAAREALAAGRTRYTSAGGLPELNQAIFESLTREGVKLDGAQAVVATPGAKQAVFYAVQALVNPGDRVLLPEPAWVSYREIIGLAGGEVVSVDLDPDDNFRLDADKLIAAGKAAGGVKVLLLNSPCNPTGRVLSEAELKAVAHVAEELDLMVISDEIYGRLVYPPHQFRRLASLEGLGGRVVTVDGFSKAWAMTGWRLGYVAGPAQLIGGMRKLQGHTATCPAEFTQVAGITALRECDSLVAEYLARFCSRNELVVDQFSTVPGIRVKPAEGAFYAFLDVREVGDGDDVSICERFLNEAEVAMVPGSAFGAAGKGFLRMSFAASEEDLTRSADRLRKVLA
jgi:aspartate aminotransferase